MKILKKIFLAYFFIIGMFTNTFGFRISSEDFDQRIDIGGYKEFIIENKTTEPVRYKFTVGKGNSNKDMSKWVNLYPKVMNIPPLEKRILKMQAQSPEGVEEGEYSFSIVATPLIVPVIKEEDGKITGTSTLGFVPIIEMLGYVGDAKFEQNLNLTDIKIEKVDNEKVVVTGVLENKTFAGINIGLKFIGGNGSIMDGKYLGRISKNKSSRIKVELKGTIEKAEDIKAITIYDANNIKNIKTIKL